MHSLSVFPESCQIAIGYCGWGTSQVVFLRYPWKKNPKLLSMVILEAILKHWRRISCHGRNHSQASCEYSLTIFLCCQHHSEYSLLGSKFSTNLLFAASKCHVTMQQRGSSRCSKWPNRVRSLQWWNIAGSLYKEEEDAEKDHQTLPMDRCSGKYWHVQ